MKAGIYIHVPFCAKKCPYCDFYSAAYRADTAERYTEAVLRNIAALPDGLSADTVYFGGGTPSMLPPAHIERILRAIRERCDAAADAEITLEANPLTMTDAKLSAWRESGINRLSVGVQSFQPDVLAQLGRKHTPEQAVSAVNRAAAAGFPNLSVDLMVGLAVQSEKLVSDDLRIVSELPVAHISTYMLKIEEGTPFAECPPDLLSDDEQASRYLRIHDVLTAEGFLHYEISNFAKAGFESRHNNKYWQCAPYYGIGPAAHSQNRGIRYAVPPDLTAFLDAAVQSTELTDSAPLGDSERIMLGLRLREGVDLACYPAHSAEILRRAKPLIPQFLHLDGSRLTMTPEGWLMQNAVLLRILPDSEVNG